MIERKTRRQTRVETQKAIKREKLSECFDAMLLDTQFDLIYVIDFLQLLVVLACVIFVLNCLLNGNAKSIWFFIIGLGEYYAFQYFYDLCVINLTDAKHNVPNDESLRPFNFIKSIKELITK